MPDRNKNVESANFPPPFPEGWYFVESRKAVRKAKLIQKTWVGENIVVWRDESGVVCVAEAYCLTWAPTWGRPQGVKYAAAGLFAPSTDLSTMLPASASPLPTPTRPGVRGCESLRPGKCAASSLHGGE